MSTKRELIRNKAVEILRIHPSGLRYAELHRELIKAFPDIPLNTIQGSSWDLHLTRSREVFKPTRGLFKYRFILQEHPEIGESSSVSVHQETELREEDFYGPFANWLKNELGECTEAVPLGGNSLGKKWGTPDVIGVYKPSKKDLIQFQLEVISAEIKIDSKEPITAFGQAVAYRLFSSKVYLVEPTTMTPEDVDRIESLCMLFGIGLVLFELNAANPAFRIRVRAQRFNPDIFYTNELADRIYDIDKNLFNRLF